MDVPVGHRRVHIALSALYHQLLFNPLPGYAILSGLQEWERSRRLTDTWAANTPCLASVGELGWEERADEEILLSSFALSPPGRGSPCSTWPAKPPPPPAEKPKPLALPPPPDPRSQKSPPLRSASPSNRAAAHRGTRHNAVDMGRG